MKFAHLWHVVLMDEAAHLPDRKRHSETIQKRHISRHSNRDEGGRSHFSDATASAEESAATAGRRVREAGPETQQPGPPAAAPGEPLSGAAPETQLQFCLRGKGNWLALGAKAWRG